MIGNLAEWTAEWSDLHTGACRVAFADDAACLGGDGAIARPGAWLRGGGAGDLEGAGLHAISSALMPDSEDPLVRFRCAR
jgi:formylglycine-generating enzyme required for sulfatase activity